MCGNMRYIFSSPETLSESKWRAALLTPFYQTHLAAVFIDEAHCVDMWGIRGGKQPFRADYKKIGDLRSFLPAAVPFVALTATASHSTRKEIASSLNMHKPAIISTSPN